ncbi:MAG: hypothetical protein K0Q79_2109 [Flavipsychrobacter sp.]|jgi:hypothetical protein|nr:hypothetical protein [Flavipsychrobacter sp.]
MTKVILPLIAIVALASCLKRSTANQKNWYCEIYDSTVSNIPYFSFNGMKVTKMKYDAINENDIKFIMKKNTYRDTFFFRNDTLVERYFTMGCTQIE